MSSEKITIRRLSPDEWELFRDLSMQAKATDPAAFGDTIATIEARDEATWRAWMTEPFILVAEVDGVIAARITFRHDQEWDWIINGVYTDPAYRRQGLGRKLFDRVFDIAREKNIKTITLKVNPSQKAAVELYTKLGFKTIDTYHRDASGVDEYVMEYSL